MTNAAAQMPAFEVEAQGIIYDAGAAPEAEAVAYCTSLCPLASGTWMAGWQCGPEKQTPKNTIRMARSRDGGESWEQLPHRFETTWDNTPGSFLTAEMAEAEAGRLLMFTTWVNRSEPDRPLFDPDTEGLLRTRLLMAESTDEGDTWGAWSEIGTGDLTGCAITGPIIRWSDELIACTFESFKEFDDPTPVEPAAWLVMSRDGARSFSNPWRVAKHPQQEKYYWDQRLCATSTPGEFINLFWTHSRTEQRDLKVHLQRATVGEDSTEAEAEPVETAIPGQIAASAIAEDGRLLAFVVDRDRPGTMTLWQSNDNGETWPAENKLIVHTHDERAALTQGRENIDFAEYWDDMAKWSFGHPAIRPFGDRWLLAWYAGSPERMSLHWARVVEG
ncbi:MAG: hypothetical protein CMJ78_11940 [Planctomycetaceae bacterium]|nr:hypothetical protein [Planctomycetaceae bacterium]